MTEQQAVVPVEEREIQYLGVRGEDVKLNISSIRRLFNVPKATDEEVFLFMRVCEAQRLNPFLREAYIIKYDAQSPASIVVGKDTFTQRAETNPDFDGYRAGIIVARGQQVIMEEGSFLLPSDKLLGGWFEGRRKRYGQPFLHKVALQEYSKSQSTWKTMPATMIRKVAVVQGLREMFPTMFGGLYDQAEMGINVDLTNEKPVPLNAIPAEATAMGTEPMRPSVGESFVASQATQQVIEIPEGTTVGQPTGPVSDELGGINWELNEKFQSWSARNTTEGGWYKLGTWTKDKAAAVTGQSQDDINADLKVMFGVTASKLTPEQAGQYLASIGAIEPVVADDPQDDYNPYDNGMPTGEWSLDDQS
jgi:phage recombination protein Bet